MYALLVQRTTKPPYYIMFTIAKISLIGIHLYLYSEIWRPLLCNEDINIVIKIRIYKKV